MRAHRRERSSKGVRQPATTAAEREVSGGRMSMHPGAVRDMGVRDNGRLARGHNRSGRQSELGQALVETAILSVVAVMLALGMLMFIPVHRARTVATSAAYACTQFISQSPNPNWAIYQAKKVALKTLSGDWSGTLGVEYTVEVIAPTGPSRGTGCKVSYHPPLYFNLLGLGDPGWSTVEKYTQSEAWKARWR